MSTEQPPSSQPGWYPDPWWRGNVRWWDGTQWTGHTSKADARPRRKTPVPWGTVLSGSKAVARALVVVDGLALLVTLTAVLFTVVLGRPLPLPALLLVPAVALLAAGQLWVILVLRRRLPSGRRIRRPRAVVFGGLARPLVIGVLALAFGGWLAAILSIGSLAQGSPLHGTASCPWELRDHGTVTCVTYDAYQRAQAGEQRFVVGILTGFFAIHFGVALSEVRRDTD